MAKESLDFCLEIYQKNTLILCSGGCGALFNTASQPHAYCTKKYLVERGISGGCFLEFALSTNTVEDPV
jgi:hypothetical protein